MTMTKERPAQYEEWVAHESDPIYVHVDDADIWATRPGWWRTTWRGDTAAVLALGAMPKPKLPEHAPPSLPKKHGLTDHDD